MKRLKIALVAHGIHFRGGMERSFAELTRALCDDHDVHLFASEVGDVPREKISVHAVNVRHKPIAVKFLQFYAQSSRMLRAEHFDIVHTIGGITARQDMVTAQYCQHAWGDAIKREAGAAEGITAYHQFMWRLTGYFERRAVTSPLTRAVGANSERTKADLIQFYGTDANKISVIYNGVDPVRFTPENRQCRTTIRSRYGISETEFVLFFAGEYRRKGLANVIRALGQIKQPNVRLLAVGQGDHARYRALAAEAGVGSQVTLAGPTRDIEQVFGAVDAFVFPTLYEPFGMVITEAMASGLPVITSRRAGAAEFITEGLNGFLLDTPGDPAELAGKLRLVTALKAKGIEMGTYARESVLSYTWKTVAGKTLALYEQISKTA